MQEVILTSIPLDTLKAEISETLKKELPGLLATLRPAPATDYLTRKQAANLLGISLPTLNEWTKTGRVQGYRIASRVRYKRVELETALLAIKTTRRAA